MAGSNPPDGLKKRLRRIGPSLAQMVGQGRAIQIARNARTRKQRINRRGQQKTGAVFRKEQRLVAEWIPSRDQPACVSVPDNDGEWPSTSCSIGMPR